MFAWILARLGLNRLIGSAVLMMLLGYIIKTLIEVGVDYTFIKRHWRQPYSVILFKDRK